MTVYPEKAACFNGYDGDRALELAALASNPANKDDAIDRAVYQAYSKARGKDVDQAARDLADLYTTEKYYGFNPVVKRTVADVVEKASGKKLRVAKGIVSLVLKTNPTDGGCVRRARARARVREREGEREGEGGAERGRNRLGGCPGHACRHSHSHLCRSYAAPMPLLRPRTNLSHTRSARARVASLPCAHTPHSLAMRT